ncbi:hypothetical protein [Vibrio anguillarum]|uniref:hypothetical protein n=1 Tax=Vibrio anguillarum TaxID=55601 RepID=UPI0030EB960B
MKKHILLSLVLFVTTAPSLAKGIFLNDLNTEYKISDQKSWENSPYAIDATPESNAFTGDKCTQGSKIQLNAYSNSTQNQDVKCYVTHFPKSDIRTHMQSNEDGDVSVGFSWDFD